MVSLIKIIQTQRQNGLWGELEKEKNNKRKR